MAHFRMNPPQGKSILAMIRGGDYAHPGEEEAIAEASRLIDRTRVRRILDVGCGRGGTAAWFERHGWGAITGVDTDDTAIAYAYRQYPNVSFVHQDVVKLNELPMEPFDLIYLFTACYAFADQIQALRQMRRTCRDGGQLVIIDYTRPAKGPLPAELGEEIGHPMVAGEIVADLTETGWAMIRSEDWTARFVAWYDVLLDRCRQRQSDIREFAGGE